MVDWVPSRPKRPEGLIVVYDGGILAPGEVAAITLQDGELAGIARSEAPEWELTIQARESNQTPSPIRCAAGLGALTQPPHPPA